MLRLGFCCILETYWTNSLPGASFGFNRLFSYMAQAIVTALDQNSLANFNALLNQAASGLGTPSVLSVTEQVCYYLVQIILGLASAVLFVINVSSFVFYAITALFGPLFIPLYMTQSFRGKFFQFIEVLLSFAMIRAVASAFIFVWEQFMNTFLAENVQRGLFRWHLAGESCAGHHGFRGFHHQHAVHSNHHAGHLRWWRRSDRIRAKHRNQSRPGEVQGRQIGASMNNIVFTVPLEPPRPPYCFLVVVFRTGLILLCIGSVIFTTIGFIRGRTANRKDQAPWHLKRHR